MSTRVSASDYVRERLDALLAFDPGLNQLLLAAAVMAGVGVSLGTVYLYCQAVHPMWIEAPAGAHLSTARAAMLDAQHHGETLLAMLIGGMVGMMAAFAVVDTDPKQLVITFALLPLPLLATLALAVQFTHDRTVGIVCMALVMGLGTYFPRFTPTIGPRAFVLGNMMFVGFLLGFLSNGAVTGSDIGPMAGVLWLAAALNLVLKLAIFLPLRKGAFRRTVRAFFARGRGAIAAALRLWEAETDAERTRRARRLHRRLIRLNETALIADALLGEHASIAADAHARLFQAELGVQNIGRLVEALSAADLPGDVRTAIDRCLAAARETHGASVGDGLAVLHRFGTDRAQMHARPLEAGRVIRLADALVGIQLVARRWERELPPASGADLQDTFQPAVFQPAVTLMFGNLPGSTLVSRAAAAPPGSRRARWRLDLPAQNALRLTITVTAAAAIGSVLSERRFYWAVLAVFVSYMGANTSGEQVFKALNRVLGTVIGILVGSLLAHAIGDSTWSILVVELALGGGIYFMRANYALMVIGITITVSQLYVQLGEFSNSLLVLRLGETAIGAALAMLAAYVLFPLRTRAATRAAAHDYYGALRALLERLASRVSGEGEDGPLTAMTRALDGAEHQLRSAAIPLARAPGRRSEVEHNMLLFGQAAHHARNLASQLQDGVELSAEVVDAARQTLVVEGRLVACLAELLELSLRPHERTVAEAARRRAAQLAGEVRRTADLLSLALDGDGTAAERQFLRHLARLDETLAELADNLAARTPGDLGDPQDPIGPAEPEPARAA